MDNKKKRKDLTFKQKLDLLRLQEVNGTSNRTFALEHGLDEKSIRRWKLARPDMEATLMDRSSSVKLTRRLPGAGSKPKFGDLEMDLNTWVVSRNSVGLRVKEKLIKIQAGNFKQQRIQQLQDLVAASSDELGEIEERHEEAIEIIESLTSITHPTEIQAKELVARQSADRIRTERLNGLRSLHTTYEIRIQVLQDFNISNSWLKRFRERYRLVSRRHTTSHKYPDDFAAIAQGYILEVQRKISQHQIKLNCIVNLDQVPRYFETEKSLTICPKGTKEVLHLKGSTSHKRMTFTPAITASGKIIVLHLLYTNYVNAPKVASPCIVDVNKTGMFNAKTTKRMVEVIVARCRPIDDSRSSILILLDSYGTHLKFVRDFGAIYEKRGVHFIIIPPNMTGLLQPLDVGVNRSFQQYFNDRVTEYQAQALIDASLQTKAGNIKVPPPMLTSEFCRDWAKAQPASMWSNAFALTGSVPVELFDKEKLHSPLRDIYNNIDMGEWLKLHAASFTNDPLSDDFEFKEFEPKHAFFKAIHFASKETKTFTKWLDWLLEQINDSIKTDALCTGLVEESDLEIMKTGDRLSHSTFEIFQTAKIINRQIKIIEVNVDQTPTSVSDYNSADAGTASDKIFLYLLDDTFLYDETKQSEADNGAKPFD